MEPNSLQYLYLLESKDLCSAGYGVVQVRPQMVETRTTPRLREAFERTPQDEAPEQQKPLGFAGFPYEPAGDIRQFVEIESGNLSRR